jgi:hypothetical protein
MRNLTFFSPVPDLLRYRGLVPNIPKNPAVALITGGSRIPLAPCPRRGSKRRAGEVWRATPCVLAVTHWRPFRSFMNPFDGGSTAVRGFGESHGGTPVWEPDKEEKLGPTLLTGVLALATILLGLAVAAVIVLTVQRHLRRPPMHDREAFHTAPQPPERAQP